MGTQHSDNSPKPVPLETETLKDAHDLGVSVTADTLEKRADVSAVPTVPGDNAPVPVAVSEGPAPPEDQLVDSKSHGNTQDGSAPPTPSMPSFRWLRPLATSILIVFTVLGLVVLGQVSTILLALTSLPAPLRYVAYGALAAGLITLGYLLAKPLWVISRLRTNPVSVVGGLRALLGFKDIRRATQSRGFSERGRIREHLCSYARERSGLKRHLEALGCDNKNIEMACSTWDRIKSEDAMAITTESFFRRVDDWYDVIEKCAHDIVGGYARSAALATAASPNPVIDSIIIVVSAVRMTGDLCKLYNVRIGGAGVTVLTGYLCVQAYAARRGQDIGDSVANTVQHVLDGNKLDDTVQGVMDNATAFFAKAGAKVAGKIAGVAVEAGVNYLLMRRLGRTVIRFLKPQ